MNGLAIASLVCGILGIVLLAWIFGYIALSQMKRSIDKTRGHGMAIAGVILGWVWLGIFIVSGVARAME